MEKSKAKKNPKISDPQALKLNIEEIIKQTSSGSLAEYAKVPRYSIPDSIEEETGRIHNQGLKQDIALKKATLWILFIFLALETVAVFTITFFQGFSYKGFGLEEWSFKLLVTVTISQITAMLFVAVKHLFPGNNH